MGELVTKCRIDNVARPPAAVAALFSSTHHTTSMAVVALLALFSVAVAAHKPPNHRISQSKPHPHETEHKKTPAQFLQQAAANLEDKRQVGHTPMMSQKEIDHLNGAITDSDTVLEFGSG